MSENQCTACGQWAGNNHRCPTSVNATLTLERPTLPSEYKRTIIREGVASRVAIAAAHLDALNHTHEPTPPLTSRYGTWDDNATAYRTDHLPDGAHVYRDINGDRHSASEFIPAFSRPTVPGRDGVDVYYWHGLLLREVNTATGQQTIHINADWNVTHPSYGIWDRDRNAYVTRITHDTLHGERTSIVHRDHHGTLVHAEHEE